MQLSALQPWPARVLFFVAVALSGPQLLGFVYATSFLFKRSGAALLFYLVLFTLVRGSLAIALQFALDELNSTCRHTSR